MAVALIIEDGSMPEGANTYASLAFIKEYLEARARMGFSDMDEAEQAAIMLDATAYINIQSYEGVTAKPGRIMAFPRKDLQYADGTPVPQNVVPAQVPIAQAELCGFMAEGEDLLAPVDKSQGVITSERVDVIAVSYAEPDTSSYVGHTGYPAVDGLLNAFLKGSGSGSFGVVEVGRG